MSQFIGPKEVKETEVIKEKTPGGAEIFKVTFVDGTVEHYSSLMFNAISTDKALTLEELRMKRCTPVVEFMLAGFREWGVRISELPFVSALLNQSLEFNKNAALNHLWSAWMPKPLEPDEVDFLTVDRVLKQAGNVGSKDAQKE